MWSIVPRTWAGRVFHFRSEAEALPTLRVDLFDTKVTLKQKRQLARSLTSVVTETLGNPSEEVTVVFRSSSRKDIARGGELGG